MAKLRVFLAEDHAVMREGLKLLVNTQPDMEVIGEAGDGRSAWQQTLELLPDVVVMDISMPEVSGAQAARLLKESSPQVKVLALTVHEEKAYVRELLQAGVSGYVLKRAAADELIHAIRTVARGGRYLDPLLADQVIGGLVGPPDTVRSEPEHNLSLREREVICLIAQGFSNKEIANQLAISIKTVETYKYRGMEKLGLNTRSDIVRYVMKKGWLTPGN
jgi:DNA-binding NarL/FixJ family response regulator